MHHSWKARYIISQCLWNSKFNSLPTCECWLFSLEVAGRESKTKGRVLVPALPSRFNSVYEGYFIPAYSSENSDYRARFLQQHSTSILRPFLFKRTFMTLGTRLGKGRSRYLLQEEIMIVPRKTPSNCHIWLMNGHVTHFWPMRNKDKPAKRLPERNFPQVKRQPVC